MKNNLTMNIELPIRLCTVNDRKGYFHMWEQFAKPVKDGMFMKAYGIVEFPEGVERVNLTDIKFCDESHSVLEDLGGM